MNGGSGDEYKGDYQSRNCSMFQGTLLVGGCIMVGLISFLKA